MPAVVHCPTCRHPLTVDEAHAGQVVTCPTCRHPLTVPALAPIAPPTATPVPAPVPADPFQTQDDAPFTAKKRRKQLKGAPLWLVLGVGPLAVLLVVAVVAVVYWQNRRAEQLRETEELLLVLNREGSYLDQQRFWLMKDPLAPSPIDLKATIEAHHTEAERMEKALNKKWGYDRRGLAGLSNRRASDYDELTTATTAATKHRLEASYHSALLELNGAPPRAEVMRRWARHAQTLIAEDLKTLEASFIAKR